MPTEEIVRYFKTKEEKDRLHLQMVLQCAPLLKGKKVACIMSLPVNLSYELCISLLNVNISYHILYQSKEKHILYFYRKESLETHLYQEENINFLEGYGYSRRPMEAMFTLLSQRMTAYYRGEEPFPHEMGIFLGYPVYDVIGFIENEGNNSVLTGYWKVYQNVAKAREIFASYDWARELAVREMLQGKELCEIANKVTVQPGHS